MAETVEIHIRLLDEGTECSRPTQALDLGNGLFQVLPTWSVVYENVLTNHKLRRIHNQLPPELCFERGDFLGGRF